MQVRATSLPRDRAQPDVLRSHWSVLADLNGSEGVRTVPTSRRTSCSWKPRHSSLGLSMRRRGSHARAVDTPSATSALTVVSTSRHAAHGYCGVCDSEALTTCRNGRGGCRSCPARSVRGSLAEARFPERAVRCQSLGIIEPSDGDPMTPRTPRKGHRSRGDSRRPLSARPNICSGSVVNSTRSRPRQIARAERKCGGPRQHV